MKKAEPFVDSAANRDRTEIHDTLLQKHTAFHRSDRAGGHFFGSARVNAVEQYFQLQQHGLSELAELIFSEADNYRSIDFELALLAAAWAYLKFRRFNFGLLNFSVSRYTLPLALLLIACAGIADVFGLGLLRWFYR